MIKKQLLWIVLCSFGFFASMVASGQQVDSSVNGQVQGAQVSAQADPSVQPESKPIVSSDQSGGVGRYELRMDIGASASGAIQTGNASESALPAASLSSGINVLSDSDGNTKVGQGQTYTAVQSGSRAGLIAGSGVAGDSALEGGFPDSTRGTAALGSGWNSEGNLFLLSSKLPIFNPGFSDHQLNPSMSASSSVSGRHAGLAGEDLSWMPMLMNPYKYFYSLYGIPEPGSQGLMQASDLQTNVIDWSNMELQYTLHPGIESEMELQQAGTLQMNPGTGY